MMKNIDKSSLERLINQKSSQDIRLAEMMAGRVQIPDSMLGSQKTERQLQVENVMRGNSIISDQVKSMTR